MLKKIFKSLLFSFVGFSFLLSPLSFTQDDSSPFQLLLKHIPRKVLLLSPIQVQGTQPLPYTQQQAEIALSKVVPAVVTVEVSKKVQSYEMIYGNPFADNPDFKNINIQVPIAYRQTLDDVQVGAGSGFIISHNGFIATNKHVVYDKDARYTVAFADGSKKTARVYFIDPNNDVAIIKVDGTYPTIASLNSSDQLSVGQPVIAIGNALGKQSNTVASGSIIGFNRTISASDTDLTETLTGLIQSNVPILPGFSGGPLIDLQGNVIGINVAKDSISHTPSSFAIQMIDIYKDIAPYSLQK
jgi:S1-C subfamily serine protease